MSAFLRRVEANILPKSVSKVLTEALKEWRFTEHTQDHEDAIEACQMCEQEELRYHFEIANGLTRERLWVGSQCILRFQVAVFEEGVQLGAVAAKRKMAALLSDLRLAACLRALERLAIAEDNVILANALDYYRDHNYLTPKQAFVVLWRLNRHNIDHSPSFFKVRLKREQHRDDLAQMEPSKVRLIWPALTATQRRIAEELGHSPPSPMVK